MDSKLFASLLVLALLIGGIAGYFVHGNGSGNLGATVNYSNSGGSSNLYNELASIVQDIAAINSSARGLNTYSSSSVTFGSLAVNDIATSTLSSSTGATVSNGSNGEAAVGDIVVVGITSSSPSTLYGVQFTGQVVKQGVIQITASQTTSSIGLQWTGGAVGVNAIVYSASKTTVVPALVTTTSTSN